MRINTTISITSLLLLSFSATSQNKGDNISSVVITHQTVLNAPPCSRIISYEDARREYQNINGSPYLFKNDHSSANLVLITGQVVENVQVQYDLVQHEVLVNDEHYQQMLIDRKFINRIEPVYGSFTYALARAHKKRLDEFFEVLHAEEDFSFFRGHHVSIVEQDQGTPGMQAKKGRFVRKSTLYFCKDGGDPAPISMKKLDLADYLSSARMKLVHKAQYKLGLKKIKKVKDLVAVLQFTGE